MRKSLLLRLLLSPRRSPSTTRRAISRLQSTTELTASLRLMLLRRQLRAWKNGQASPRVHGMRDGKRFGSRTSCVVCKSRRGWLPGLKKCIIMSFLIQYGKSLYYTLSVFWTGGRGERRGGNHNHWLYKKRTQSTQARSIYSLCRNFVFLDFALRVQPRQASIPQDLEFTTSDPNQLFPKILIDSLRPSQIRHKDQVRIARLMALKERPRLAW